jgi:hypothetical protein
MTTQAIPEVTITVSRPYQVEGYQGGRYGLSPYTLCEYSAEVLGKTVKNTSKADIMRVIRAKFYVATGSNRVRFTFTDSQEG